jgi:hypothetical protein
VAKAKDKAKVQAPVTPSTAAVMTKAAQVKALSDALIEVRNKRFEIDQSPVKLTPDQRMNLANEYDTVRDAYYKGISELIDSSEPAVASLLVGIAASQQVLKTLEVSQENAQHVLDAISAVASLASKLVVVGAAL